MRVITPALDPAMPLASPVVLATRAEWLTTSPRSSGLERERTGPLLALPLLWALAAWVAAKRAVAGTLETNTWWFDGRSARCRAIRSGATSWRALELLYDHLPAAERGEWLTDFWFSTRNAQAVRNRLRLCRQLVRDSCPERDARILSVASGSARAVLEVAAELDQTGRLHSVRLIDIDVAALERGMQLARRLGLARRVEVVACDVLRFDLALGSWRPNVIEMVGLLDYLRDRTAVALLRRLQEFLAVGEAMVTAHIHPNTEAPFLRSVVDWGRSPRMLYRTRDQFLDLLVRAGARDIRAVTEPHGIHTLAVTRSR